MDGLEKFPFYKDLTPQEKQAYAGKVRRRSFGRGEAVHRGDCAGLIYIESGRLRVYTLSEEGREFTLYRLCPGDVCLLSASCALTNLSFDVFVTAETDCALFILSAGEYKELSAHSLAVAQYTNALMAERFSRAMWVLGEVMGKKFGARLAALLLQERGFAGGSELKLTHEQLAGHLGCMREAVSRTLKYFEEEGLVSLFRGGIRIENAAGLQELAGE